MRHVNKGLVGTVVTLIAVVFSGCPLEESGEPKEERQDGITCGSDALYAQVHDACGPMDAAGQGACYCGSLGWIWEGNNCVQLPAGSCECVGADCDRLAPTEEACLAAHGECSGPDYTCGSEALHSEEHDMCEAMDATGDDACFCMLGFAWDGEGCVDVTGCECTGDDCDALAETEEACLAAHGECTEPDYTCGSEALHSEEHDMCDGMDAQGEGLCHCSLGWAWNGTSCEILTGCECVGGDCNALAETEEACLAPHDECVPPDFSCGSSALYAEVHDICSPMDAVGQGGCFCASLGWIWDGSSCVQLPAGNCECVGADCDRLSRTEEECLAAHSECAPPDTTCGSPDLHSREHNACEAMDASGDDACYCMLGFAWDGEACVGVTGCECTGADCQALAETEEACLAAHGECTYPDLSCGSLALYSRVHTDCTSMDAAGQGACYCGPLGWRWDGSECVQLPGGSCECVGEDCERLTRTEEECLAAHRFCS